MDIYSLYTHIPFCRHRCGYCDFNTYAGLEDLIPDYVSALCREIEIITKGINDKLALKTIFFGGGTPSLLPVNQLERILEVIHTTFHLLPGIEITLEANPGTLSLDYLTELRQLGFNRISLGVQSTNSFELALLERQHSFLDVIRSVNWARQAGFDNLNLDLIFGLPGQKIESWQRSVENVLDLQPEHLSVYALTLEHGTPMENWAAKGLIEEPDPDLAADMYEWVSQRLEAANYLQYEISNWARETSGNYPCQHNLQYWRNWPYLGVGAGAHGFAAGVRTVNVLSPSAYIQRCLRDTTASSTDKHPFPHGPATISMQVIDNDTEMNETMMMGLRLVIEGISAANFQARFGQSLHERFGEQITRLVKLGLLEWSGFRRENLRLTEGGRLLGNQVFREFV